MQGLDESTRRSVSQRRRKVRNVMINGSLSWSDHEMIQIKTLWAIRKLCIRLMTLGFRRTDCSFFRKLVVKIPQEAVLKGKEAQKS